MLAFYVLVPTIHLARARLPFHERDKVVTKLGVFDFDGVFHEAGRVTQLARRLLPTGFSLEEGEDKNPPN